MNDRLEKVFAAPDLLLRSEHSLCPGCGEPLALRTILELVAELGARERTICVAGIGCYTAFPPVMDVDVMQALHGRAPSVATGIKRVRPDALVFTMQGDGDMISEGLQEVLHVSLVSVVAGEGDMQVNDAGRGLFLELVGIDEVVLGMAAAEEQHRRTQVAPLRLERGPLA